MPNLRKMEITTDFNGNLGHIWNVTETFTDILKNYFLQRNAVKFAKV